MRSSACLHLLFPFVYPWVFGVLGPFFMGPVAWVWFFKHVLPGAANWTPPPPPQPPTSPTTPPSFPSPPLAQWWLQPMSVDVVARWSPSPCWRSLHPRMGPWSPPAPTGPGSSCCRPGWCRWFLFCSLFFFFGVGGGGGWGGVVFGRLRDFFFFFLLVVRGDGA